MKTTRLAINPNGHAFDLVSGNSYDINEVGCELIDLLNEGKPLHEISRLLSEKYDLCQDEIHIDVVEFFTKLRIFGIVE